MNCFDCATELDTSRPAVAECASCGAAVCARHAVAVRTYQPVGLLPQPVRAAGYQPAGLIPQPVRAGGYQPVGLLPQPSAAAIRPPVGLIPQPAPVRCATCAGYVAKQPTAGLDFAARIRAEAPGRRERVTA